MANPQQPELRRSETTPGLTPDSIGDELEAARRPDAKGRSGKVPEANRPGHSDGPDQDKPDLDKFAEKFGLGEDGPSAESDGDTQPPALVAAAEPAGSDRPTPDGGTVAHPREGAGVEQTAEASGERAARAAESALQDAAGSDDGASGEEGTQVDLPRPVEAAATAVGMAVGVAKAVGKRLPGRGGSSDEGSADDEGGSSS